MKKKILTGLTALSLCVASSIPALASTVYYNGSAVSWEHGRTAGVYSYSKVQSTVYEHSATANTTSSGWKSAGALASASEFVGTGTATAYWNCR